MNRHHFLLKKRTALLVIAMFAGLMVGSAPLSAQEAPQWALSDAIQVQFQKLGGIGAVVAGSELLMAKGYLNTTHLSKKNVRLILFQGWGSLVGNAVDIKEKEREVTVGGVLGGEASPDEPRQIEFTESYTKMAEGVFLIHVEAKYLANVTANEPLSYMLRFPVAAYAGGSCQLMDADGAGTTYKINNDLLPLNGIGASKAVFSKGMWSATLEPGKNTALSVLDSRAWEDDALVIKAWEKQPWIAPFSYSRGTKQTFEVTVSFIKSSLP